MISITIDSKKIEVEEGTFLLDAARELKIPIPTLCHHKALTSDGNCRLCLTEVTDNGRTKLVTACNYPIRKEIQVQTKSEKVVEFRKDLLTMMLSRWPNVPIIKEYASMYGAKEPEYKHPKRNEAKDACILCTKCVRACDEITWEKIIGFAGRGPDRHVEMPLGKHYDRCTGCATCAACRSWSSMCCTSCVTRVAWCSRIASWTNRAGARQTPRRCGSGSSSAFCA